MRIFGLLMCAVMMVSSFAVFAGSDSGFVGAGESVAEISLSCYDGRAKAETFPIYTTVGSVRTKVWINGGMGYSEGNGTTEAETTAKGYCREAHSTHYCDTFSKSLTVANN